MTANQALILLGAVLSVLITNPMIYRADKSDNFKWVLIVIVVPMVGFGILNGMGYKALSFGFMAGFIPTIFLQYVDVWKYIFIFAKFAGKNIPIVLAFIWKYTVIFSKFVFSLISKKSEIKTDYKQAEPIEIKPQETKHNSEKEDAHKRKNEEMQNLFDKIDKF